MAVPGVFRHPHQGVVVQNIERVSAEVVDRFRNVYSAFVLDHFGKHVALDAAIRPIRDGMRLCGPAVTQLGADLSVRRMAIDLMSPGDVLVVAAGGSTSRSCFGDGTARRMGLKSLEGVVIDGLTRDSDGIAKLGFPTFARGATARNHHYPAEGDHGGVNVPVVCGGVLINPGDLVLADGDGVVVVDRVLAEASIDEIEANLAQERSERAAMTEFRPFDVRLELESRGYRFT